MPNTLLTGTAICLGNGGQNTPTDFECDVGDRVTVRTEVIQRGRLEVVATAAQGA